MNKWMDFAVKICVIWTGIVVFLVYEDTIAKMYGHPSLFDYIHRLWN